MNFFIVFVALSGGSIEQECDSLEHANALCERFKARGYTCYVEARSAAAEVML